MQKSSSKNMLVLAIILSALMFRVEAFAAGFKIEDGESKYVTKIVTAKNVKGLEISGGEMQTEMYCRSNKRVSETIYSGPVLIKSSMNNKIEVLFIIPDGYGLDVRVVE